MSLEYARPRLGSYSSLISLGSSPQVTHRVSHLPSHSVTESLSQWGLELPWDSPLIFCTHISMCTTHYNMYCQLHPIKFSVHYTLQMYVSLHTTKFTVHITHGRLHLSPAPLTTSQEAFHRALQLPLILLWRHKESSGFGQLLNCLRLVQDSM